MSLVERQQQFEMAIREGQLFDPATWHISKLFGVSNSAIVIEGGLFLGTSDLENFKAERIGAVFLCVIRFPPEDEVYFAVYINSEIDSFKQRLNDMKEYFESGDATFSHRNNLVRLNLGNNGRIYLRNKGFWPSMFFDRESAEPSIGIDRIVCAVYPPSASAQRSLMAREFIGYLARFVGREKLHEIRVWDDSLTVSPEMRRMPSTVTIGEIESSIEELGGHYTNFLVERFHVGINHLDFKHFVILTGISGTGKTSLVNKYSQAIHGIKDPRERDPFLFVCPVRPDWTDPTGLLGYYDVISNRYMVPLFLEAVLVATAHRDTPIFVCIDEMNLARVEYYLSEVLSAMESRQMLHLHSSAIPLEGSTGGEIPASIPLPTNLYIIGTVNIDESTQPLSDKVLDRAITIDMSSVDIESFLHFIATKYENLKDSVDACRDVLITLDKILSAYGLGFGYRIAEEFVHYYHYALQHGRRSSQEVLDDLVVEKILVKLRGTERHRQMLQHIRTGFTQGPKSRLIIEKAINDLDEFGAFQILR